MVSALCSVGVIGILQFLKSAVFLTGYIQGSNLFPEPLSSEEEKIYLEKMASGDEEARNLLIERNLRLVAHVAKKYANTKVEQDDLISIGTIGLIKGIRSFKVEKGARLSTYVSRCIDNEILMYLRKIKRKKTEVSFEDSLSYDSDGNELHLEDVLGTEKDIVTKGLDDELDKNIMLEEINKLNPRDKEIIELRYGINHKKEMTQKDVANLLGISQSYISRIEKKVIKKLKSIIRN